MKYKLTTLEKLHEKIHTEGIQFEKHHLPGNIKGFYYHTDCIPPIITVSTTLDNSKEETCVIAEELGHYYTSFGNLLTDSKLDKTVIRKQEEQAKRWAIKKLVTLKKIVAAFENGARNISELAEYLDVTNEFLLQSIETYNRIYGKCKKYNDRYILYFEPFGVLKLDT